MKILGKEQNVLKQRNLFGTLLGITAKVKVDMKRVATFPMVEFPPAFATPDGHIQSTDKSKLISALEAKVKLDPESHTFDVEIIDGSQVLRQLKNVPTRIADISALFLKTVTRQATTSEVHVLFDRYPAPPTLKDYQHSVRHNVYERCIILDGNQVRSRAFSVELNNPNFKEALARFFVTDWINPIYAKHFIARNKDGSEIPRTIFVNHENGYKYYLDEADNICRDEVPHLTSTAVEVDVKIALHLCKFQSPEPRKILIKATDTDVFIIVFYHLHNMLEKNKHTVCQQVVRGNTARIINMCRTAELLEESVVLALPALHAFTGCDFSPCFYGIGKKTPLNILLQEPTLRDAFQKLRNIDFSENAEMFSNIEHFVCKMYKMKYIKQG